jgi:hypothetical protein
VAVTKSQQLPTPITGSLAPALVRHVLLTPAPPTAKKDSVSNPNSIKRSNCDYGAPSAPRQISASSHFQYVERLWGDIKRGVLAYMQVCNNVDLLEIPKYSWKFCDWMVMRALHTRLQSGCNASTCPYRCITLAGLPSTQQHSQASALSAERSGRHTFLRLVWSFFSAKCKCSRKHPPFLRAYGLNQNHPCSGGMHFCGSNPVPPTSIPPVAKLPMHQELEMQRSASPTRFLGVGARLVRREDDPLKPVSMDTHQNEVIRSHDYWPL